MAYEIKTQNVSVKLNIVTSVTFLGEKELYELYMERRFCQDGNQPPSDWI